MNNYRFFIFLALSLLIATACLPPPVKVKVKDRDLEQERIAKELGNRPPPLPQLDFEGARYRKREPIPVEKFRYEGSIWEGESSWGNLMRDHRARYRGDVLIVKDIQKVFEANENYKDDPQAQNILSKLNDLSVRVVKTLDNGNLAIYGEKLDYRESNNVRFKTVLKGVIRPEDINDDNEIMSDKIARFEVFTEKKIRFDPATLVPQAPLIIR